MCNGADLVLGFCGSSGRLASGGVRRVGAMNAAERVREEEHFRKVEGVMMDVEYAARRLDEAAKELKKDDAAPYLVAALETAADAVRADHARLMKSVYWRAPSADQEELAQVAGDQQRLAS